MPRFGVSLFSCPVHDPHNFAEWGVGDLSWFVADWGVVTVGPFRLKGRLVRRGEELLARYRILVHDGIATAADIAARLNK